MLWLKLVCLRALLAYKVIDGNPFRPVDAGSSRYMSGARVPWCKKMALKA